MDAINKTRKLLLATTAAFSLLALSACNENTAQIPDEPQLTAEQEAEGTNSEVVSDIEDAAAGLVGQVNAEFTETTQGFAEAISLHTMYEIAAAEIAIERAASPEVKDLAENVLAANEDASDELAEVVRSSNIPVQMPNELDGRHQGMLDNLTGATDEDFEGRFIEQQINAHTEALTLFEDYAEGGRSPPVRDFAAEMAPEVRERLAMAERLHEELSVDAGG
jgi:putative membrane protein